MDSDATLEELEGIHWADPDYSSSMVERIRALGRMPLREFTAEDYRLILTEQRALGTLVPLALELLEVDPFAEGDLYPGDLLVALTRVQPDFWEANVKLRIRAKGVVASAIVNLDEVDAGDREELRADLAAAYERF